MSSKFMFVKKLLFGDKEIDIFKFISMCTMIYFCCF
jgi:hypothetical protein